MMPRAKRSTIDDAKLKAEARFKELIDEIKLLTVAFPHLHDAYEPEDLPIPFLLKRGAERAERSRRPAASRTARPPARKRR
jgi:hypothetical protein